MRAARRIITVVLLIQVAWSVPLAVLLGLSSPAFLFAFGGVALVALALLGVLSLRWRRTDADRAALLATGLRTPALLVASRATNTRIDNRVVQAHTFESRATGRVIRVVERSVAHLPIGTRATIAYDSVNPARAILVEDPARIATAGQVSWESWKQAEIDKRFTDRPPR